MRAVVVRETGDSGVCFDVEAATPPPARSPGEVLIRVAACGICTLDVVTRNGTYRRGVELPLIPGHEICGTVAERQAQVWTWLS